MITETTVHLPDSDAENTHFDGKAIPLQYANRHFIALRLHIGTFRVEVFLNTPEQAICLREALRKAANELNTHTATLAPAD